MILQIESGGRTRAVDVTRHGDRFLVTIDGHEHEVDVKEIDGILSLLIGRGGQASSAPPTRSYEVSIAQGAAATLAPSGVGGMMVHVDGVPVEVSIMPARQSWGPSTALGASGAREAATADGPQQIKAPMPGKIVKLLVKPGDKVDARQGLVVVEAMKMENELRARAAGTVSEVRVAEGSSVEAGAILVVLE